MAELENLLLEAAGRTNYGKDSDDHGRKKEVCSQIPFKKRCEQTRSDEEEEEEEEDDDDDDSVLGSDLFKDDDDRKRLADMTELQREMILADRATKRDDKLLRESLRRSNRSTATIAPPSQSLANTTKLSLLRWKKDSRTTFGKKGPSNKAEEKDSDSGDDELRGVGEPPLFEEVKSITIQRSDLAKWLTEPFFTDLVAGCFVRIGIGTSKSGPIYRLCQVQRVEDSTDSESKYVVEGKRTRKYLVCFWGSESAAARWKMAAVSNSPPTEEEFRQWSRVAEPGALTRQHMGEKVDSLERARSHHCHPRRPVNVAVEKDRLRRRLEAAEGRSNHDEAERVRGQLAELEASRWVRERDERAARLSEMNRRNRVENLKTASEGPFSHWSRGDELHDPFSRRWTRSRNYYEKEKAKPVVVVGPVLGGKLAEVDSELATSQRSKQSDMLSGFDILISSEILKCLGGHKGAQRGYIARKQRIEATVGFRVLEDDGKRHSQTITVSDYKRRRGLL